MKLKRSYMSLKKIKKKRNKHKFEFKGFENRTYDLAAEYLMF